MDITYLGHSSFKIRSKNINIVTDPYDPEMVGLKFPKTEADIVTISHQHGDHNYLDLVTGRVTEQGTSEPFIVDGPGEYEIKGVNILGISTFHDNSGGSERGKNTIYEFRVEGLTLIHCGDLGHKLTEAQKENLSEPDILFIPTGGSYTIDPIVAGEVITQLEPKIIIPMHYQTSGLNSKLASELVPVTEFLKVMGKGEVIPQDKLIISKDKLPEETQIVILN
ncbi:MBL fold metallo-hydrolase [Candidatus Gottesmanbacteria bacterium]|nr:MBL fold metallo-hydrolase [Candidatus Gottesmanbacteria bacterium]